MNIPTAKNCTEIQEALVSAGLYSLPGESETDPEAANHWRISPEPYYLTQEELRFFNDLGGHLLKFYQVLGKLYADSANGKMPGWVAGYLDQGKPQDLLKFSQMKRFRNDLPGIIRPDVIPTEKGYAVTELDSVPGGFGVTSHLSDLYAEAGARIVGAEAGGIMGLFYEMLESSAKKKGCTVAVVVSDEAADYRPEMDDLGRRLRARGLPVYVTHPKDLKYTEENLWIVDEDQEIAVDVVYRFYELFDLANIPKSELIHYSLKKGRVRVTPPYRPFMEEKLAFALFSHPILESYWEKGLGSETFSVLSHLIPKTWILDNCELPPQAVIPGLNFKGSAVQDWKTLETLTQKERELVVKPSGFSPDAWGSRGVVIGHDVSGEEWSRALREAQDRFESRPSILQEFHKGRQVNCRFWDWRTETMKEMAGRVRLTPYYFVVEGEARLGGILATVCPRDKKKIHGMTDAVMVPCAVH